MLDMSHEKEPIALILTAAPTKQNSHEGLLPAPSCLSTPFFVVPTVMGDISTAHGDAFWPDREFWPKHVFYSLRCFSLQKRAGVFISASRRL